MEDRGRRACCSSNADLGHTVPLEHRACSDDLEELVQVWRHRRGTSHHHADLGETHALAERSEDLGVVLLVDREATASLLHLVVVRAVEVPLHQAVLLGDTGHDDLVHAQEDTRHGAEERRLDVLHVVRQLLDVVLEEADATTVDQDRHLRDRLEDVRQREETQVRILLGQREDVRHRGDSRADVRVLQDGAL